MAVKAEPSLESQAVAGAEADRRHRGVGEQCIGQRFRVSRRHRNLEAVLAGIAGARDEAVEPHHLARAGIHEAHLRDVSSEPGQHLDRLRPLQGEQGAIRQNLDDAVAGQFLAQQRLVFGLAGGVDHQEQVVAKVCHHQVVENAAGRIGELGITLAALRNRDDILRHQPF